MKARPFVPRKQEFVQCRTGENPILSKCKTENPRREPPRAQTEFACQYIREQADRSYRKRLSRSQVLGGGLGPLAICDRLVGDFLAFVEIAHSCAFDCADVHKHIFAAVVRLDEAEALLTVKPFHGSR